MSTVADLAALAAVLPAEDAAAYGAAALAGRLAVLAPDDATGHDLLTAALQVHLLRRDAVVGAIRGRHGDPAPAPAAYVLPALPDGPAVLRAAAGLEGDVAHAWRAALATLGEQGLRTQAVAALRDAAVRQTTLLRAGGLPLTTATSAFPGA